MVIEIILALIAGLFFGIITGLIPGIHTNLISALTISILPFLISISSPITLIIFITTMTISSIFLDFIPSTYLGAPDEDTALSTTPGQELLMKGKAHQAIRLSTTGALIGLALLMIVIPLFFLFLANAYPFFEKIIFILLIWISALIIYDSKNKFMSFLIFILAGFLGISSLNLNINQSLLPLLTGLYGTSSIIISINQNTQIPSQDISSEKINKKDLIFPSLSCLIVSPLCSFLPGLGGSQATVIGSKIFKEFTREQFIILNGAINSSIIALSFVALFLIQKSRTGSAAAISQITTITISDLWIILTTIIAIGILSYFLTLWISKKIANKIDKINYRKISLVTLSFLILITIIISGFFGLIVLAVSTLLGITCQLYGIKKSTLMACLLIPTMIIYWPC